MREMWIVIKREFRERVRTRAFILSTILLPIFAIAIFAVPYLMGGAGGGEFDVAIIDETPEGIASRIALNLAEPGGDAIFRTQIVSRPLAETRDSLTALVRAEELDGFLRLGPDFVRTAAATYRGSVVTNMTMIQGLRAAVSQAIQSERLDRAGLDATQVSALLEPATLQTSQITRSGAEGGDTLSTMILAYFITFLLYLFIILYGTQVMQSVHEEKGNRIAEVLMSSVTAPQLLAGKVFGVGGAALVQMLAWGGLLALAVSQRGRIAQRLDIPAEALAGFQLDPLVAFLLLLYALLGFFLYASLYAAAGAATQDMQDAQQFVWILVMPLIIPLILQFQIISAPHGPLATAVGWIPLTSPLAMPLRMGTTEISGLELTGSLTLLALSVALTSWVAGKIYRIGMLSTGRRASLREIWRWLRYT
ncbi:MAG: ABC transporter permease [Gemmatimonadota bacterium]